MYKTFGSIFILASFIRFICKKTRKYEAENVWRVKNIDRFIVIFELIVGILLITTKSKKILNALFIFLLIGCIYVFFTHFKKIIKTIPELFIFDNTAVHLYYHVLYLFIIFNILKKQSKITK